MDGYSIDRPPDSWSSATEDNFLSHVQWLHRNQAAQSLAKHGLLPKLKVGPPNDTYEREADRVADAVLRTPSPSTGELTGERGSPPTIQRLYSRCQRRAQMRKLLNCPDREETLQRKESGGESVDVPSATAERLESSGGGRPLSSSVRSFFELRFGHDFSEVRIHDGKRAAQMNRSLGARAFTHGRDVYFENQNTSKVIERVTPRSTRISTDL